MIKSWSYSKLETYEQCPLLFKLQHIEHLCPTCFAGEVIGWDESALCNRCGAKQTVPEPIARGNRLHDAAEEFIRGKAKLLPELEGVKDLLLVLRKAGKVVRTEFPFVFDQSWTPVDKYTKGAWFRGKGDVVWFRHDASVDVIDWKSGGIDKRTGAIRVGPKYDDQVELYQLCSLLTFPAMEKTSASLVFFDAPPTDNTRTCAPVERKHVPKLIKKWAKKTKAMLSDTTHAPLPNEKCRWCAFSKGKGGPCQY